MKLSLTVEADTVNVLALNMGRIVVDIDGIALSELIAAVNQNGCPLQIADDPGNTTTGAPPPPLTTLPGICCSTAHITEEDNPLFHILSHQTTDFGESEWIHFTGSGYLIHLVASSITSEAPGTVKSLSPAGGDAHSSPRHWNYSS